MEAPEVRAYVSRPAEKFGRASFAKFCTAPKPRLHLRVLRSVLVVVAVGVLAREVEDHGREKVTDVADGIRCHARLMTPAFNSGELRVRRTVKPLASNSSDPPPSSSFSPSLLHPRFLAATVAAEEEKEEEENEEEAAAPLSSSSLSL